MEYARSKRGNKYLGKKNESERAERINQNNCDSCNLNGLVFILSLFSYGCGYVRPEQLDICILV